MKTRSLFLLLGLLSSSTWAQVPSDPLYAPAAMDAEGITFNWAPSDTASSENITGYSVTMMYNGNPFTPSAASGVTCGTNLAPTARSCTAAGLTLGQQYVFLLSAQNANGSSTPAAYAMIYALPPDAPENVSVTPGNGQVTLTWDAPINTNGSAITSYTTVTMLNGSADGNAVNCVDLAPTTLTCTITGLAVGTEYEFGVQAKNSQGNSAYAYVTAVTEDFAPNPPDNLIATPAVGSVVLNWAHAPVTVGSARLGYQLEVQQGGSPVTYSGDCASLSESATSCTASGLTPDLTYTFSLRANNAFGLSAPAGPVSATPLAATVSAVPSLGHAALGALALMVAALGMRRRAQRA